ncbi:protein DMP2-like [Macadamia integrifolia]|uniref:protein DMP2-like n=1 Tax=Macadamia integrifolia TaxID=60698 RepID=UPI001C4FFB2F|nr:protein DMP2-like [Macadamia integrifolia]
MATDKTLSSSSSSSSGVVLTGVGNLIKLLPTGTVFLYQFLSPILTNSGQCHMINKYLTGILLGVCGFSCCFSSFTDSYKGSDGLIHYGIATIHGLWSSTSSVDSSSVNLSKYKLRIGDFVHASLSLLVFAVVVLLDSNTMDCYYPTFESTRKTLVMTLPAVVGTFASSVFAFFPNDRHGIGYPKSQTTAAEDTPLVSISTQGANK